MAFRPSRSGSFAYVAVVYVLAVGVAWLVFQRVDAHPLLAMTAGFLASVAVTYAFTLYADNGSVFDAWWSVLPPFAALYFTGLADGDLSARQVAVHAVVWFWGVRLTSNWARGWPGLEHEDWRYVDLVAKWPLPKWAVRLLAVELFPALIVTLGCLPLYPALALGGDSAFGWLDGLALTLGIAAVSLELVADEQLHAFARVKQPGQILDHGLWSLSRHPNYLGEIGFWVSLWLFALAAEPSFFWTGIGAAAMIVMFVTASIPLLDERSRERRPGFAEYEARTPALLPWFRPRRSSD